MALSSHGPAVHTYEEQREALLEIINTFRPLDDESNRRWRKFCEHVKQTERGTLFSARSREERWQLALILMSKALYHGLHYGNWPWNDPEYR